MYLPGPTSAQSRVNLIQWIDVVAVSMNLQYSMVYDQNNQRVPGSFHHRCSEFQKRYSEQDKDMAAGCN